MMQSLVRLVCCNKMPQIGWFINLKTISHRAGGYKSEVRWLAWLGEDPLSGCRLLTVSLHGEMAREFCGASLIRVLISIMRVRDLVASC